jgi:hypothetical protein
MGIMQLPSLRRASVKKMALAMTLLLLIAVPAHARGLEVYSDSVIFEKGKNAAQVRFISHETETADVVAEILIPKPEELKNGYLPIPNADWIALKRNNFSLASGEDALLDLELAASETIQQPRQAMLWIHTTGGLVESGIKIKVFIE